MQLHNLRIRNFRGFDSFELPLQGKSASLVGENGIGKSAILTAIARGLGVERGFGRNDFNDLGTPIEIEVILRDFTADERGDLAGAITFEDPPSLTLLVRATWDPDVEEVEVEHVLPGKNHRSTKPDERSAIQVVRLPADRDVARMLAFGFRRNILGQILDTVDLEADFAEVSSLLSQVNTRLGSASALTTMLSDVAENLTLLRAGSPEQPLSVGQVASTIRELLGSLELHVAGASVRTALRFQSSGIAQLVGFSFLLHRARAKPGSITLIDEPEDSLHPQAQRALMRALDTLDTQVLLATHSSNLLQRADPRRILRLRRDAGTVEVASPQNLTEAEARKLARFTNPHTAEAFFARAVVLVEGLSDKFALETLASRQGKNLDSLGVSIIPLDGGDTISTFLRLLGRNGFQVHLVGLCDLDHASIWRTRLEEGGYGSVPDQAAMESLGFFTCDQDLEDELIRALGVDSVKAAIDAEGDTQAWRLFCRQPVQRGTTIEARLRSFLGTRDRKIRYAPTLVERLDLQRTPRALEAVLSSV